MKPVYGQNLSVLGSRRAGQFVKTKSPLALLLGLAFTVVFWADVLSFASGVWDTLGEERRNEQVVKVIEIQEKSAVVQVESPGHKPANQIELPDPNVFRNPAAFRDAPKKEPPVQTTTCAEKLRKL